MSIRWRIALIPLLVVIRRSQPLFRQRRRRRAFAKCRVQLLRRHSNHPLLVGCRRCRRAVARSESREQWLCRRHLPVSRSASARPGISAMAWRPGRPAALLASHHVGAQRLGELLHWYIYTVYRGSRSIGLPPAAPISGGSPLEPQLLQSQNAERATARLAPLAPDDRLASVARTRANDMAARGYFAHSSPSGETAFSVMGHLGISYGLAGENLARNN
jgi:hypothetical protein